MSVVETQCAVVLKQKGNKSLGHNTGGEIEYYLENQHCFEYGIYLGFLVRRIMQKCGIYLYIYVFVYQTKCVVEFGRR